MLLNFPDFSVRVIFSKPFLFTLAGDRTRNHLTKVDVDGGGVQHIAALSTMSLDNPNRNWEMYSNWADSVRSFPQVTKQKVSGEISKIMSELKEGLCVRFGSICW